MTELQIISALRREQEAKGVNLNRLAHRIGASRSYMKKVMNGEHHTKLSRAIEIADELGCEFVLVYKENKKEGEKT